MDKRTTTQDFVDNYKPLEAYPFEPTYKHMDCLLDATGVLTYCTDHEVYLDSFMVDLEHHTVDIGDGRTLHIGGDHDCHAELGEAGCDHWSHGDQHD